MKITRISAQNYLGIRAADIALDRPVQLFAGRNGAGKSSLMEGIRHALTGETVRVSLKKDYGSLLTEGAESGFVEVVADGGAYAVALPSGKGAASGETALRASCPIVFRALEGARNSDIARASLAVLAMQRRMVAQAQVMGAKT